MVSPRRAAEQRVVLVGATASIRPGRSKDKRTFGRRSQVEPPGTSKEGAARWEATPELVSQDRERVHWGLRVFRGPGYEYRQILRSAQWGLAAMPAPISVAADESPYRRAPSSANRDVAALPLRRTLCRFRVCGIDPLHRRSRHRSRPLRRRAAHFRLRRIDASRRLSAPPWRLRSPRAQIVSGISTARFRIRNATSRVTWVRWRRFG